MILQSTTRSWETTSYLERLSKMYGNTEIYNCDKEQEKEPFSIRAKLSYNKMLTEKFVGD